MKKLSIAIPGSVVSDIPHLREKTSKIGYIGRAAAIFRVDEVIIYPDLPGSNQKKDMNLIATLLTYMETPQYLRKTLFELNPDLQYAGILPPLRTPHHPLNRKSKDLRIGEFRDGVILSKVVDGNLVDIGTEQPALVRHSLLTVGGRVTVKVVSINNTVEVRIADQFEIAEYWGYRVILEKRRLGEILNNRKPLLTLATSKYGEILTPSLAKHISEKWNRCDDVLVAFGSPSLGLDEIVKREGLLLASIFDFIVSTIPSQGTKTVRTEEAVISSLAVFNILFAQK